MPRKAPNARKGRVNRVVLNRCRVAVETLAQIGSWRSRKVSQGALMDRLVAHAKRTNFNPATDCL
jgi:hypothetical protein